MSLTILCAGALARPRNAPFEPAGPGTPPSAATPDDDGAFARALRRARVTARPAGDGAAARGRAATDESPHETWLRARFGLDASVAACALPPAPDGSPDLLVRPVHLRLALDHAVLAPPASLALDAAQAAALAGRANEVLVDEGLRLVVESPGAWRLIAVDPTAAGAEFAALAALRTCSARLAIGRDVDAFQPSGAAARRWRRLDTLVQMAWFDHPANAAREAAGHLPVNALWLEGAAGRPARRPFASVGADNPAVAGLARRSGAEVSALEPAEAVAGWLRRALDAPGDVLLAPDPWQQAAERGDPDAWTSAWREFDRWFDELSRQLPDLSARPWQVVLTGEHGTLELVRTPADRWKPWRRLRLSALAAGSA